MFDIECCQDQRVATLAAAAAAALIDVIKAEAVALSVDSNVEANFNLHVNASVFISVVDAMNSEPIPFHEF